MAGSEAVSSRLESASGPRRSEGEIARPPFIRGEHMGQPGLEREPVDRDTYDRTVERFREAKIVLPTFSQLADPSKIPDQVQSAMASVEPDEPHPLNLFRVHWY